MVGSESAVLPWRWSPLNEAKAEELAQHQGSATWLRRSLQRGAHYILDFIGAG